MSRWLSTAVFVTAGVRDQTAFDNAHAAERFA